MTTMTPSTQVEPQFVRGRPYNLLINFRKQPQTAFVEMDRGRAIFAERGRVAETATSYSIQPKDLVLSELAGFTPSVVVEGGASVFEVSYTKVTDILSGGFRTKLLTALTEAGL